MTITSKYIPFKGYKALNMCGILFVREGAALSIQDLNHERIHTEQMKELLYIGFYVWYILEWIVRLLIMRNAHHAYRTISFEREAYIHDWDLNYVKYRKHYKSFKYILL